MQFKVHASFVLNNAFKLLTKSLKIEGNHLATGIPKYLQQQKNKAMQCNSYLASSATSTSAGWLIFDNSNDLTFT